MDVSKLHVIWTHNIIRSMAYAIMAYTFEQKNQSTK